MSLIRQELRAKDPNLENLMDITFKLEKNAQEKKDARILEILKLKDKQIDELSARCNQQESEYERLV